MSAIAVDDDDNNDIRQHYKNRTDDFEWLNKRLVYCNDNRWSLNNAKDHYYVLLQSQEKKYGFIGSLLLNFFLISK